MIIEVTNNGKSVWLNTDKIIKFYTYKNGSNPTVTIVDYEAGDDVQMLTIAEEAKWLQQKINAKYSVF